MEGIGAFDMRHVTAIRDFDEATVLQCAGRSLRKSGDVAELRPVGG